MVPLGKGRKPLNGCIHSGGNIPFGNAFQDWKSTGSDAK